MQTEENTLFRFTGYHCHPRPDHLQAGPMHGFNKPADHRRSNKPIMEKRRRARINHCLTELKSLILEAMKKDPARHSKLEKADILEMTVKHLQVVQRQQMAIAVATDPTVMTKFRSGFSDCAAEVVRYVSRMDGVDPGVSQRLMGHMRNCLTSLNHLSSPLSFMSVPQLHPAWFYAAGSSSGPFGFEARPTHNENADRKNGVRSAFVSLLNENDTKKPNLDTEDRRMAPDAVFNGPKGDQKKRTICETVEGNRETSKPSTSRCSGAESEKMWRPW